MSCSQVTKAPLTALRLQENGRIAAVGAADGSTSVLRLSDSLADMQPNEKYAMTSVSCHSHTIFSHLRSRTIYNLKIDSIGNRRRRIKSLA